MRLHTISLLLISLFFSLGSQEPFQLVLVHLGPHLPSYVETALAQARLFNEDCLIVLIADDQAIHNFHSSTDVTFIPRESLSFTAEHEEFKKMTKFSEQFNGGYLRYATERFFYLYDYMIAHEVETLFHIESDVLLYTDLRELFPLCEKFYSGIATPFESDSKGIGSFVFIHNQEAMGRLVKYFAGNAANKMNDMQLLGGFRRECSEWINCLPMMTRQYFLDIIPKRASRFLDRKSAFCLHVDEFMSIFDGSAIGVFFDGLDPAKGNFPPGVMIKEPFNPSLIDYIWVEDEKKRKIPYARYDGKTYRINNLHIASKRLVRFISK